MKHLNSAVVQAAQSNPGRDFVNSDGGQIFTIGVIAAAVIGIVWLVFFKGRGGKSES